MKFTTSAVIAILGLSTSSLAAPVASPFDFHDLENAIASKLNIPVPSHTVGIPAKAATATAKAGEIADAGKQALASIASHASQVIAAHSINIPFTSQMPQVHLPTPSGLPAPMHSALQPPPIASVLSKATSVAGAHATAAADAVAKVASKIAAKASAVATATSLPSIGKHY